MSAPDTMMLFGGLANETGTEAASNQVWRFIHDPIDPSSSLWRWQQLGTNTGPSARFSHTAVYDVDHKRMLVYGGIGGVGQFPVDTTVWQLQKNPSAPNTGVWRQVTVASGPKPPALYDHTLQWDDQFRTFNVGPGDVVQHVQSAVLFGGTGASGAQHNEVWRLLFLPDSSLRWVQVPILNPLNSPSPRSGHTATFESGTNRMFILGGTSPIGALDDTMYVLDLGKTGAGGVTAAAWGAYAKRGAALTGHVAGYYDPIFNRVPEVHPANGGSWTPFPNAPLLEQWYPQTFVIPGSTKVFVSGPGDSTWTFDPVQGTWAILPTPDPKSGFTGGSAVMYQPGYVMKCCTRDTEVGATAVGTTKTINLTAQTPSWYGLLPGLTFGRVNMNLTLLPTGQVIATGGTGIQDNNHYLNPRLIPEIWDPVAGVWSGGSGAGTLAASSVRRGYHSTAILLPDARILCAGGNIIADSAAIVLDPLKADIYCPPYLFNSDGTLATRPVSTPPPIGRITWKGIFTVSTTAAATIKSVCLIKPGATTHAFDMDQRYVPLSYFQATNPSRLLVSAPQDSTYAPPGDYLLFIVDSTAGAPRVPSVASWLRVGDLSGRDSSDSTAPGAIGDLYACADTTTRVDLTWTAPQDDGAIAGSGQPLLYDIRRSYSPITDANWTSATQVTPAPPLPATPGSGEAMTVTGLSANHTYYFRMKTRDDNFNYSALSNQAVASTHWPPDCGGMFAGSGGGGGGLAARPASALSITGTEAVGALIENSVLDGISPGSAVTDVLRLAQAPSTLAGAYDVRLRTEGPRRFAIDRARLLICDHDPGLNAYWAAGQVVLGTRTAAKSAMAADGSDIAAVLAKGDTYFAAAGAVLALDSGADPATPQTLIIEAGSGVSGGFADSSGILVQSQDKSGAWQKVAQIHPRRDVSEIAVVGLPGDPLRLAFLSDESVSFVGSLNPAAGSAAVQAADIASAVSVKSGDQKPALIGTDSLAAAIAGPDTLMLSFSSLPLTEGLTRDYFLALDATMPVTSAAQAVRSQPIPQPAPAVFALEQNRPNPFSQRTTIRFQLPVGEAVKLELFDAQGRRVRTLASHYFPAGSHSVEWDHTNSDGQSAGPGIYFYRMEAGPFRDRKKMVLLAQ